MDSVSDDAQLVLQQLFQNEIDLRTGIENVRSNNDSAPYHLLPKMRQKLSLLKIKSAEQLNTDAENFLSEQYRLHTDELQTLQMQLRNAVNVQAEKKQVADREELMGSGVRRRQKDPAALAEDVTNRMQRNTQILAAMVRQQEETVKTLATSSNEVTEVDMEYRGLTSVLHTSHRLVSKYGRRVLTDTFLTYLGFFLFLCTVLYVLQKRLF